ncbi:MAG: GxxExxY protein [Flavobacteriales bacterium]|nr:GxxExxY protein [Flavobacteriales bacterium]
MELLHEELTGRIIKSYYKVYNNLGFGFLEKVYENALHYELLKSGLGCVKQQSIEVTYDEIKVGQYFADLIVENTVIVEIKAAEGLVVEHEYQLVNYLKATDIEVGLLLNFGKEPAFRRKVFTNKSAVIS